MGVTQQKLVRTNPFSIQATLNASTGGGCLDSGACVGWLGMEAQALCGSDCLCHRFVAGAPVGPCL